MKRKKEWLEGGNIEERKPAVAFAPFVASELDYISCSNLHLQLKSRSNNY